MSSRDEYVAVIKQAFITLGKEAAMKFLMKQVPLLAGQSSSKFMAALGLKFLNPIAGWLVGMAIEGITEASETAAFFLYIDMRVGQQGKDFEAAAFANYSAQREGTEDEKVKARKKLEDAFLKFAAISH